LPATKAILIVIDGLTPSMFEAAVGDRRMPSLTFLAEHGCDEFQGYYFSRPLSAEECGLWLKEKRLRPRAAQAVEA